MSIQQQVSRAIRILQGNRDVSARASHLAESNFGFQAEMEKFSKSTFSERKIMSTKTSIKRIAAVAAVALTLGGFSAVSAHAAANGNATPTLNGASTGTSVTQTPTVGTYVTETLKAGTADSLYTITSSGVGSAYYPASAPAGTSLSASSASSEIWSNGTGAIGTTAGSGGAFSDTTTNTLTFSAYSAAAGIQTITVTGSASTAVTYTLVWGAAPSLQVQYSSSQIVAGANGTGSGVLLSNNLGTTLSPVAGNVYVGTNDAVSGAATYNNTSPTAVIGVTLNSSYNTLISGYLTATITGAGQVGIVGDSGVVSTSSAPSVSAQGSSVTTQNKDSAFRVAVFADGRAGVGTVTISSGTTVIATKTVTFYTLATTATPTQNLFIAKAGSALGDPNTGDYGSTLITGATVGTTAAFTVVLKDANGNAAAPAQAPIMKSSNSAVIVANGCYMETAAFNTYDCLVSGASGALSGASATVTFSIPATTTEVADYTTGLYSIKAASLTFTIGGSIKSETITTDAASYASLAPVALTVTAKDSSGNLAYDQDVALFGGTLTSSVALAGTASLPGTAIVSLIKGVHTYKGLYAPATVGDFTISGVDGTSAANAVSVTANAGGVSADSSAQAAVDAANEATDAANAATDAANNAMDSADAAQQAALDAGDKADAALAAVTDLATKVSAIASQIASLSALVKKIAAKVKA